MTLATTWRFVNVAWWLFSLYGAIWIMARRPPYASVAHRILVLSVTQAIALILFTLGFILEPTLWILLNQGVLEIPEALDSLFTVSGFVSHVFEPALLPASVAVLTAAITARRSSRVLFCASSTVAVLLAYDLVIRLLGKPVQSPLVFSVFSDVLGGTLAGALVAFTWSVLIDTPHSPLSRRQASIGLITLRTILIAGTGSYLVFLRYLPESVVLDLRAWDTVSFEYVGTRLSYSRFLPTMATSFTVSSPTGWVTGTLPGEARLELYDEETLLGERPTQIFVTIAELVRDSGDPVATPIDLLVGARTIFSGQIEGATSGSTPTCSTWRFFCRSEARRNLRMHSSWETVYGTSSCE